MPDVNLDLARPFYLIQILDKDSNDLKFVWSPNIFMDNERPEDDNKIAPNSYIEDIEVKSNFEPPINNGEVKINHSIGSTPNIAINDILKIYFGYYTLNNSQNPVYSLAYTGQIDKIKASLNHTIVRGSSKIKKLTDHKRDLFFSKAMTIKEIIQKLAVDDAGLEAPANGISYTSVSKQKGYGISKNLVIYKHVKKLADLVDFDIYMDPFDKFNARLWQPEESPPASNSSGQTKAVNWISSRGESESDVEKQLIHTVYFGVNTIDLELDVKTHSETSMEIITLADSEGDEVFTINPPVGTSGGNGAGGSSGSGGSTGSSSETGSSAEETIKQVFPRFTKEDSDKIAEVIVRRSGGGLSGKITVIGSPQIRLGDGLKIMGQIYGKKPFSILNSPTSEFDATFTSDSETQEGSGESTGSSSSQQGEETLFKITEIKHLYNDKLGFITKLNIKESEIAQPEPEEEEGGEEEEEEPEEGEEEEEEPEEGEEEEEEEPEEGEEEERGEEEEEIKTAQIIEVEDALFHHDSAVLLPSKPAGPSSEDGAEPSEETEAITGLAVISAVLNFIYEHPDKKMVIAGHTDTTGRDKYNFELSSLRAKSVLYLLIGNKPMWVDNSDEKHKVEDYQQIFKHYSVIWGWDCDPGAIDNINGPKTTKATRNFQDRYNKEFNQSISVDGVVGKQTWSAIFDCYMKELEEMQASKEVTIAEKRTKIQFISDDFKFLACGESHPIEASQKDNYRSQINRRVEILFFDPDEEPTLTCPSPTGPYNDEKCNMVACALYREGAYEFEYIEPEFVKGKYRFSLEININPDDPAVLSDKVTLLRDDGEYIMSKYVKEGLSEGPFTRKLVFTDIPGDSGDKTFSCDIERENVEDGKYIFFKSIKILQ